MGKKRLTAEWLRKHGVKEVLIPGMLAASILGWMGWAKISKGIYANKQLFPETGIVQEIVDGDTFQLANGVRIRMIGINAPDRGQEKYRQATEELATLINQKQVFLEYDRYQDDKNGRDLAWVWIDCESKPKLLPADYMHKSNNESNPGLTENPEGCKRGKLAQEEMIKAGLARVEIYKDRGELKYERRISLVK